MKCPKCQRENREGAKFCIKCGAKFEVKCPNCGSSLPSEALFCDECGHTLAKPKEAPSVDYSEPQSYTPKFLADKILTTRGSIEGERKLVTVLFADVANYTSISEKLDPEEVHQIMDGAFKILMVEIHKYEGTINQFTGDGVMALFGAPVAHEDHAQRACYAALSIQKALGEYGEGLRDDCGIGFKMRIGLNTGNVVVGSIGDDLRMDYTAIGDTTNLAARMESVASAGSVLVSKNTYKLTRDFFEFETPEKIEVKGKDGPQEAYRLLRTSEVDTRFKASVAKGLARFVGRKNSMPVLMGVYEKAKSGSGQVVGIVGEAGVGKSRLHLEFRNRTIQDEYTYLEGRCLHYGGSMAYLPILDILRSYFEIKEGDREYIVKKKIKDKTLELDKELANVIPPFQDLLSLKVDEDDYVKLEPKQKREETFEALRDLLIRLSQGKPLVVAVEDLHWIDKTTEEFLDYLIGWLANSPILLILLFRPEYTHQWGSKSYYSKLGLTQLTTKSGAELVQAVLEEGEVAPELRDLILNRAAGNPLFMEEFTYTLLENNSIQKKDNQYVLSRKVTDIQVPDTIQGIIAARMDRLEDNLKRTLQVASVIGRDFAFRILHTITGMKEELKSYLLNLQRLEFIYEKSLLPELEYIFKHALTQEVAYNSLLLRRRKEIHEKIGRAIEQIYPERLEEFYEMLAYHYYEGEDWEKALEYLAKAGDKLAEAYANQEALDFYAQALEVCGKLGASTLATSVDLAKKRGLVHFTIGDFRGAIADFNRMRAAARSLKDRRLEGMALAYRGRAEHQNHDVETVENTLKAALALADEGFDDVRFFGSVVLAGHFLLYNRHAEAEPLMQAAKELAPGVDDPFILSHWGMFGSLWPYWQGRFDEALKIQAHLHGATRRGGVAFLMSSWVEALARGGKGEYAQAFALLEDLIATAKRMGDLYFLARALNTMGWLYGEVQDHRQAMAWNTQGVDIAKEINAPNPEVESNALLNLGDSLLALNRLDEAEEHFQIVEQVVRNPRPQDQWMLWRYSQHLFHSYGELCLDRSQFDKALAYADECLALAEQSKSLKNMVKARRLRGQVFLRKGKLEETKQEISIALKIAQRVCNPTQLWKTYTVLGDLYEAQGRPNDARQAYSHAFSVIEEVADGVKNRSLKETFLGSEQVQEIRQKVQIENVAT